MSPSTTAVTANLFSVIAPLRLARKAMSAAFYGFAATEFGNYVDSTTLLEQVSSWVGTRLNYVRGSSNPIDGAADTLLAGAGVCRDFLPSHGLARPAGVDPLSSRASLTS